jgi:hypothetical protein
MMSKAPKSNKENKKQPVMNPKEKKAAKKVYFLAKAAQSPA